MIILWIKFIICAGLILIFGLRLSTVAHRIVKRGRFSEGFMGIFFLALITSFPEVSTSIASVTKVYAPNLGVGDLIGSCIINLMIIALIDLKVRREPILSIVSRNHLVSCTFSLITLGILLVSLSLGLFTQKRIGLFSIGIENYLIICIYMLGAYHMYRYSQKSPSANEGPDGDALKIYAKFALYGGVIIACGFWLASLGKTIADIKGWDEMYLGTLLIAFTTSLPEIVVSIGAVSIGSPDMALANIVGSNLFNILLIPLMDAFFRKGYISNHLSSGHIYSVLMAIILTFIVFTSILYRVKKSFMRLGAGTILMILTFAAGNILLFNLIRR